MEKELRFGVESTIEQACPSNIVKLERVELDMQRTCALKEKFLRTKVFNTWQFEKGSVEGSSLAVNLTHARCKLFNTGKCRDFGSIAREGFTPWQSLREVKD